MNSLLWEFRGVYDPNCRSDFSQSVSSTSANPSPSSRPLPLTPYSVLTSDSRPLFSCLNLLWNFLSSFLCYFLCLKQIGHIVCTAKLAFCCHLEI